MCRIGQRKSRDSFRCDWSEFQTLDGDLKAVCAPCLYWRLYFVKHFASTQEILNNRHHIRDRSNEIEILCEIFYLIKEIAKAHNAAPGWNENVSKGTHETAKHLRPLRILERPEAWNFLDCLKLEISQLDPWEPAVSKGRCRHESTRAVNFAAHQRQTFRFERVMYTKELFLFELLGFWGRCFQHWWFKQKYSKVTWMRLMAINGSETNSQNTR